MSRTVPYDAELEAPIAAYLGGSPRDEPAARTLIDAAVLNSTVEATDLIIPTAEHARTLDLTVFRDRRFGSERLPVVYYLHGGGLVAGTRGRVAALLTDLAAAGAAGVTVEYRLAPHAGYAQALDDCFAGLLALDGIADEFALDVDRTVVGGASAGGGLAAALALAARDRGGPRLIGQLLDSPMLDDRSDTVAAEQFATGGVWSRAQNAAAWAASLSAGPRDARSLIPARAQHLGGLPPAYLSVGSAELFRDEVIAYASGIWREGGRAELHVWSGACHAFEALNPHAAVSRAARRSRQDWLARLGVLPPSALTLSL
jgi:acetyl esterase/lipase